MKTYTFTIEVPEATTKSSFIENLRSEISDEKRQLEITTKINIETTKVHNQILNDIVSSLNEELDEIGLGFIGAVIYGNTSNSYQKSISKIHIHGVLFELTIDGIEDRNFKDSKYTTYTSAYNIRIRRENHTEGVIIKHNENLKANIFSYLRDSIKKHMECLELSK